MKKRRRLSVAAVFLVILLLPTITSAQPYGKGIYNTEVPYGSQTSLSIATNGNISIPITPGTGGSLTTGVSTVTITSTDVMGYKLYIKALSSTNMDNLGTPLPTSLNGAPAPLAVNTWGYNTDASANFVGITLTDTLIRSITTPASSGSITNVTFGANVDLLKPIGNYTANIIYTAVPQTN